MDCSLVQNKLSLYVDGVLDEATLEAVEFHVKDCGDCCVELEALQVLTKAAGEIEEIEPPADLRGRIFAAVDAEEAFSVAKLAGWIAQVIHPKQPGWTTAAVTAAAVIGLIIGNPSSVHKSEVKTKSIRSAVHNAGPKPAALEVMQPESKEVVAAHVEQPKQQRKPAEFSTKPMAPVAAVPAESRQVKYAHAKAASEKASASHEDLVTTAVKPDANLKPENVRLAKNDSVERAEPGSETETETPVSDAAVHDPDAETSAPSLLKIAVAPSDPARDMHEWVESVKQEHAARRRAQKGSTIQLFDKKF